MYLLRVRKINFYCDYDAYVSKRLLYLWKYIVKKENGMLMDL